MLITKLENFAELLKNPSNLLQPFELNCPTIMSHCSIFA